jgi:hypothetical protein
MDLLHKLLILETTYACSENFLGNKECLKDDNRYGFNQGAEVDDTKVWAFIKCFELPKDTITVNRP